ncbi:hypothetical protein CVT24_004144 [Panaeolus cyanescens]|uniref:Uncharacterized protein n=1 Tax=Panaeolus cyanescens TaxID=181874 RepID=A0A409X0C5_9AGAR|nr:hypothetical protein CVT24_004144 [Panaeolus cyanescens]
MEYRRASDTQHFSRLSALEFMISLSEAHPVMVKKMTGWTEVIVRACLGVHAQAAAALINFCKGVEHDTLLPPYLDVIVVRVLKLLNPKSLLPPSLPSQPTKPPIVHCYVQSLCWGQVCAVFVFGSLISMLLSCTTKQQLQSLADECKVRAARTNSASGGVGGTREMDREELALLEEIEDFALGSER